MTVPPGPRDDQLSTFDAALIWHDSGCSVIPIRADGTKRPAIEWKKNQVKRVHPSTWHAEFGSGAGIGVVCGDVSGNLEMTELEGRAFSDESIQAIGERCDQLGVGDTFALLLSDDSGYSEITPSGGIHLLYRITDHEVPGNTKIARRPATWEELEAKPEDKIKVLAETRGEGGYVVVAPTGGTVHPTGEPWEVLSGQIGQIPEITWEARNLIHQAIYDELDEMPPEVPRERVASSPRLAGPGTATRPGDAFNERADWADILEPHGWTVHHVAGGTTYWTRPGKSRRDGHSATTGHAGAGSADRLYVMSSATEFDTDVPLSKFYVYAHYEHRGDLAAATRTLASQGYGDQAPRFQPPNYDAPWQDWQPGPTPISKVDSPVSEASPILAARPRGRRDYTLTGACVRFVDEWGKYIRFVAEQNHWRIWDGVRWIHDQKGAKVARAFEALTETMYDEAQQMLAAEDPNGKAYASHVKKLRDGSRASALSIISSHVTCSADEFDADPRYLNLRNGVYDVVACTFGPHDPKYMLTKVMGVAYKPEAKATRAEKFFAELMPDFEQRDYVMRALGYTLTGEADQRAFFLLHGLPGTGKTQFIEMMQEIFGDYGVTAMASTFHKRLNTGAPTPDLHALRGARFISSSETSQDSSLDEELIKRFTGKDMLSTRSLYEEPQQWVPQGTIWLATNHLPKFASDEDAIWRRVKTLPFNTQFSDDGSVGQVSEPNLGRRIAAEEADGIFNLLLVALAAYRGAGRLAEPEGVKKAVAEHKKDVDPVAQFWDDSLGSSDVTEAPGQQVEFTIIYQSYCNYHRENIGGFPLGRRRFADSLRSLLGYERLLKSNGKTYLPGWTKAKPGGWIVGGFGIGDT